MFIGVSLEGSTALRWNCVFGYHGGTMSVGLRCESIMPERSSLDIIKEICDSHGQNTQRRISAFVKQPFFMSEIHFILQTAVKINVSWLSWLYLTDARWAMWVLRMQSEGFFACLPLNMQDPEDFVCCLDSCSIFTMNNFAFSQPKQQVAQVWVMARWLGWTCDPKWSQRRYYVFRTMVVKKQNDAQ